MRTPKALHPSIAIWTFSALAIDQLSKALARSALELCSGPTQGCEAFTEGPLTLIRYANAGSALGFSQGRPAWLLVAASALLLVPAVWRSIARHRFGPPVVALIIAGALGNLSDRLLFGAATDIVAIGHLVINIADIELFAGVTAAMVIRTRPRQPTAEPQRATAR
jgi:lipoprotein signal peptidase